MKLETKRVGEFTVYVSVNMRVPLFTTLNVAV
jgi:hypothetical protein